jgi:glycosyltransferase involved in cell wall biosynthesis
VKILCIIQCTNLGGMEQSALLLLEEFQNMGHQTELISLNNMGELGELLKKNHIPASSIGYHGKWGWRSFLPLRNLLKTKQADGLIMVGHNLMAMLALGNLCAGNRLLSIHFHHEGVLPHWVWRIIYHVAVVRFKYIIYPSRFIMHEAQRICPFLNTARRTISYPISLPIILPEERSVIEKTVVRQELNLPADAKIIGNAGWLIPRKRWDIFLRVAQLVLKEIPDARFLIAGDGPELPKLKQLAVSLGVEKSVVWLGWQKDLENFYHVLDVLLFNSDWDAMGRTPLEAMSHGVPVVASVIHGGLNEIIDDDAYGFFINTHDVPKLAARVVQILTDPKLAAEIGKASRARIEEVGSPRLHAEKMLNLLEH